MSSEKGMHESQQKIISRFPPLTRIPTAMPQSMQVVCTPLLNKGRSKLKGIFCTQYGSIRGLWNHGAKENLPQTHAQPEEVFLTDPSRAPSIEEGPSILASGDYVAIQSISEPSESVPLTFHSQSLVLSTRHLFTEYGVLRFAILVLYIHSSIHPYNPSRRGFGLLKSILSTSIQGDWEMVIWKQKERRKIEKKHDPGRH